MTTERAHEIPRLERAIAQLRIMRSALRSYADRRAIDTAVEHLEARLIDIRGSDGDLK